ncbi:MAG: pilus assembly protein [Paracoccaceae bacterium]|nr:pilus assembly protein [Paracoccaceae bacterium]
MKVTMKSPASDAPAGRYRLMQQKVRDLLGQFRHDERGALIVFGLILFTLMVMMGGLAVDLMRHERTRTELQQTLDRSVLAASSLKQTLNPKDVVKDYFAKAGMSEYLSEPVVGGDGVTYRSVTATATADTKPFFMHMMGIGQFDATVSSAAEQGISNIEVAMVLDISGSMQNTPSRIANLRIAAKKFVATVLNNDPEGRTSISLVPYNGQVNVGPVLFPKYTTTYNQNFPNSLCIDVPTSTYTSTALSKNLPMPQSGHFDSFSSSSQSTSYVALQGPTISSGIYSNNWCQPVLANIVRPSQNNIGVLQGYIENLVAVGATSIDLGMKWGVTMLDPGTRPVIASLAGSNGIPAAFADRPMDYPMDNPDVSVMKFIILMSDGEHFTEERLNDGYRTDPSPIYKSNNDGYYSIYHPSKVATGKPYWVPHRNSGAGEWRALPWTKSDDSGTYTRFDWNTLWQVARVKWVAWQLYARALGTTSSTRTAQYDTRMDTFRTQTPTTEMDDRLQDVCNAAKSKNIVVFTIAFEAPTNGQTQLRNCATSNSHYFPASGTQIGTAFDAIAAQIGHLRLTQ